MNQQNGYQQQGQGQAQNQDEDTDKKYEAWMQAGELRVGAEGETGEEARDNVKDLWDKATHDLREMPEEERNQVGLK